MTLPSAHPQRLELNDEVHARPPPALAAPCQITYIAMKSEPKNRKAERAHLEALCATYGLQGPAPGANHFNAAFEHVELFWERHTEFARYMFVSATDPEAPGTVAPLTHLPDDWLKALPGELLVATQVYVLPYDRFTSDSDALAKRYFGGNTFVGSGVSGGHGFAATDFKIREDGFSRLVIWDRSMTPRQAGRTLQRLLEIDSYRMMMLLALPVARGLSSFMSQCDRDLTDVAARMTTAAPADEPELLQILLRLESEIQKRLSDHHFRFSAASAYYDLVARRTRELREDRLEGMQTFEEFMERRLAPANNTCRSVSAQLEGLSERVSRATQSLATRTALNREAQNQALLEAMARRAKLQLRLQQTVEGLSVAAITYYVAGLVNYFAKGLKAAGAHFEPETLTALSVPLVFLAVWYGLKRTRARLELDHDE